MDTSQSNGIVDLNADKSLKITTSEKIYCDPGCPNTRCLWMFFFCQKMEQNMYLHSYALI